MVFANDLKWTSVLKAMKVITPGFKRRLVRMKMLIDSLTAILTLVLALVNR